MRAGDVMVSPVYTVSADDSLRTASEVMRARRVHHLPVVEDGHIIGMLGPRDFESAAHFVSWFELPVSDWDEYLEQPVKEALRTRFKQDAGFVLARPDDPIVDVASRMAGQHITAVPVVDDGGVVVGIISYVDLLWRLQELLLATRKVA